MKTVDFSKIIGYFNFHSSVGERRAVYRDWKIINVFFAVIFVLAVVADGYIAWVNLSNLGNDAVLENKTPPVINRNSLNIALDKIKKKQIQFEDKLSAPAMRDPSI